MEVSVLEVLVRQEKGNKDSLGEIKEDKKLTESLRKHLREKKVFFIHLICKIKYDGRPHVFACGRFLYSCRKQQS